MPSSIDLPYHTYMSPLDDVLLVFINQLAQRSWTFDSLVVLISDTPLAKGYLVLPLFWWAWFRRREGDEQDRRTVILTLFAGFVAVFLARFLQVTLPFRLRPIHTATLEFTAPYSLPDMVLSGWSSFPSDHACLFFTLATGLWLVSPLIGSLAMLHAGLIVSLPRIYLGLHFPTDVLSGALIGIGIMSLVWSFRSSWSIIVEPVLAWSKKSPQTFFPCFFLLTGELAHLFEDSRLLAVGLWQIIRAIFGL